MAFEPITREAAWEELKKNFEAECLRRQITPEDLPEHAFRYFRFVFDNSYDFVVEDHNRISLALSPIDDVTICIQAGDQGAQQ